jgi:hypothetical protein
MIASKRKEICLLHEKAILSEKETHSSRDDGPR